jgi:hypothetical protein
VTDRTMALAIGGLTWGGVMVLYASALLLKGRPIGNALAYNAPVALLFLVMSAWLAIRAYRLGVAAFVRSNAWLSGIWAFGFLILYLRLVSKNLEVSGHLAWLPFLTAQAWMLGFPLWLVGVGIAATLSAAYLKFAVFQGSSGGPGLLVGLVLMIAMLVMGRREGRAAVEQ